MIRPFLFGLIFCLLIFHGQWMTVAFPPEQNRYHQTIDSSMQKFSETTYETNLSIGHVNITSMMPASNVNRTYMVDFSLNQEIGVFDVLPINQTHIYFDVLRDNAIYLLETESGNVTAFVFPNDITPFKLKLSFDGSIWFTDYTYRYNDSSNYLVHFFPQNATFHAYKIEGGSVAPFDLFIEMDKVWFSLWLGNSVGYLEPTTHQITIVDILCTETCGPLGLTKDDDGRIWFVESYTNVMVRYSPDTGAIIKYPVDPDFIAPVGVTIDEDGQFWSGSHGGDLIVQFDPSTGSVNKKYYVPKPDSSVILAGINDIHPDELQRIWAVEHFKDSVVMLDKDTETLIEYRTEGLTPTAQFGKPYGNDFWFAQFEYGIISVVPFDKQVNLQIKLKSDEIHIQKGRSASVNLELKYISGPLEQIELTPFADAVTSKLVKASNQNSKIVLKRGETVDLSMKIEVSNNVKISLYNGIIGFENDEIRVFANLDLIITENFFQTLVLNNLGGYLLFIVYVIIKKKPWKNLGN